MDEYCGWARDDSIGNDLLYGNYIRQLYIWANFSHDNTAHANCLSLHTKETLPKGKVTKMFQATCCVHWFKSYSWERSFK